MYKGRKIYLCSFGNLDLYPSAIRLRKQAESFNIFDEILIYHEYNLPYDEKFEKFLRKKLVPSRGFGYWCWKAFIISKTLESMNDGDILFYTDIGCHLNKEGINKFYEYLDMVIDNGALCFELSYIEKIWTKSDLFNYFNMLNDKNITDTPQRVATTFLLLKNESNLNIVNKWLQVYYDDFSLTDDTPSKIPNADTFKEHRHDQSIFSILAKSYNLFTINAGEVENTNKEFPINALRDKQNIYDKIFLESGIDYFKQKLSWYISSRNKRDSFRDNIKLYTISSINMYLNIDQKSENIVLSKIKLLDLYLKSIVNKKIKIYIENNSQQINEIMAYIAKYKN